MNIKQLLTAIILLLSATANSQPTVLWPSQFNGMKPDSKLSLPVNNISFLSKADGLIYGCLKVMSEGRRFGIDNTYEYDLGFSIESAVEGKIKIVKIRPFAGYALLNKSLESPDCSGSYDVATNIYSDYLFVGPETYYVSFRLTDSINLELTLESFSLLSPQEIQKPLAAAGIDQNSCSQPPGFYYEEFSDVASLSGGRIKSIKNIFEKVKADSKDILLPIYMILYPSIGLSSELAANAAKIIASKQYPSDTPNQRESYVFVYNDLYDKLQKEAFTGDLPDHSCGGSITLPLPPDYYQPDFANYYGKVALHEYHHIVQQSFFFNSDNGIRPYIYTWMVEGMAEYWALKSFEALGFEIPANYIFSTVSDTLTKLKKSENKRYRNIREYDDEFGDFWPINSIDIGLVMVHYLVNKRHHSLSSIISLYESGVDEGRLEALENLVGISYEELAIDFENWINKS